MNTTVGRTVRDHQRGAALVEMALVLPLLLLLAMGIWSTARAWNVHNVMDHAAREAARYGATESPWDSGTSPAALRAIADSELAAAAVPTATVQTVCIDMGETPCGFTATGTDQVAVQFRYPNYRMDFIFFSITVDLTSSAVARHEG